MEKLRNAEEQCCGFVCRELLPPIQEQSDLGKKNATSSRLDGRAVEEASFARFSETGPKCVSGLGDNVRETHLLGKLVSDLP